ncbi:homoserine kinase [Siminovitchia sp. FSL H7-0308]|uniref:Homoserine kinase n=1 Tax=Siminovitchia thermophila TaxID=1245522 RepID=A0ABS2R0C6_9BACI|nr:homoserine kinase [Siminovitchia thermophila]MBM7713096.1 homoserine kinase [Siminovitchia thermophila]ONK24867.1 homoserine kinase [Bacillus sp. VT-16-64]
MNCLTITVPASSANIGPGFDSAGMALNRYLTLHVTPNEEWIFEHRSLHLPQAPPAEDHFIFNIAKQMAEQFNANLPPCNIMVESDIPLARGMGSSASAVVAGIELANQVCQLELSASEKLRWATKFEGHPDNVAPALLGGLVITAMLSEDRIEFFQTTNIDLDLVLYIPDFELKTEAARKVLPEQFSRNNATAASSIGNMMVAALVAGDYQLAGRMMEADLFHEPYRASLIPNYAEIRREAKNLGAYGTVISGAGPTLISFAPKGGGQTIVDHLQTMFSDHSVQLVKLDNEGLRVNHQSENAICQ